MQLLNLVVIVSALALPGTTATQEPENDRLISEFPNFVAWFQFHGGTSKIFLIRHIFRPY